ncbi:MAG: protein kinase [Chloroflexi bacterium]|nr:protein kinase [Chloroflexota bacterium]
MSNPVLEFTAVFPYLIFMKAGDKFAAGPPPYIKERYRLVEWIGEGSMGVVYRAHDERLDREIAIKFLSPERVTGSEASDRFLREARAVARLSHPNIMTLYDMGREDGWHYLVLEHIPGQDLHAHMMSNGPLSPRQAIQSIRGTLSALAYAHDQGIIHRDIKPENIMMMPDGRIKVTDFGLARVQGDARLTQEGMLLGTVLYLAPELITGQPADIRSDLYAVGAVLYELLTGQSPFPGDQPTAVLIQILNNPVTPPSQYNPAIPADIERLILKLLAKEPSGRFQSASEVLDALPDESTAAPSKTEVVSAAAPATSLVQQIVRSSSTDAAPSSELLPHLLLTAALEDTAVAVESERRRLAGLLQESIVEPLNLLLSQANVYEQTMGGNPTAKMAVSVLTTLARQVLQQARDLETQLHPTLLDTLGLEPALEALVNQTMRTHGVQITLYLRRLHERLPSSIELILFRVTQDALALATKGGHATKIVIHLELEDAGLTYRFSDNGRSHPDNPLQSTLPRIEGLGGEVEMGANEQGGLDMRIQFGLETAIDLTPREMEVIQLLAEGLSNKEMAQILSVSPRTINFHLDNIYSKLGVSSRTEAAVYALRQGWIRKP